MVIGILIALSINNWNEERKTQGNQEKYLMLLRTEAQNNLKEVNKAKSFYSTTKLWQTKIFKLIDGNQDTITEDYLSKTFSKVFSFKYSFKYENSALSELKTSGNLKNVLNDSLRKYLIALEPRVLTVQSQEQNVTDDLNKSREYIGKNGSARTITDRDGLGESFGIPVSPQFKTSNIHLLSEYEFENNLILYVAETTNLLSNHYPALENHLNKIIEIYLEEV